MTTAVTTSDVARAKALLASAETQLPRLDNLPVSRAPRTVLDSVIEARRAVRTADQAIRADHVDAVDRALDAKTAVGYAVALALSHDLLR